MPDARDYSLTTIKTLFALSGNACDMDECHEALTHPDWGEVHARISHICAAEPGGPRYDPDMTDDERRSFHNLMLFCAGVREPRRQVAPTRLPRRCAARDEGAARGAIREQAALGER